MKPTIRVERGDVEIEAISVRYGTGCAVFDVTTDEKNPIAVDIMEGAVFQFGLRREGGERDTLIEFAFDPPSEWTMAATADRYGVRFVAVNTEGMWHEHAAFTVGDPP